MGRTSKMSSGDITRIVEMYAAGRTYKEIARVVGISHGSISNVLAKAGITPDRCKRTPSKKTVVERICPKCRKNVEVAGARFCPFCGSDVRPERQIAAEELEAILGIVCDMAIPPEQKDRACNSLRNAARLLKEDKIE